MNQEKTTLEVIAPSVDEAIEKGLAQLGLPRDQVEIEVLDAGARGLFGLGARQARVRLAVSLPKTVETPAPVKPSTVPAFAAEKKEAPVVVEKKETPAPAPRSSLSDEDNVLSVAGAVVNELLVKMRVRAQVKTSYMEATEGRNEKTVLVEIMGDDLSILIGKRSETLNALQYISSLIISKELGEWVPTMIDVQGYRSRRERQLRQLANRMAEQAVHTGRRQTLEPMPANERRIIHLELRENTSVVTESVGDDPNRKVTIIPKK